MRRATGETTYPDETASPLHGRAQRIILVVRVDAASAMTMLATLAVMVAACAGGTAGSGAAGQTAPPATTPQATAPSTSAASTPTTRTPTVAATQAGLPLFDAHIHYSQDAWSEYSPERALAILREAGIRRALLSSPPDAGTMRLYERGPDLVVPMLRPYRSRDDIGSWTRDGTIVPYLETTFRRGVHRGIGEFHLYAGEAATPVLRAVVALAVREDLFLHAHADDRAVEELLRADPRAKVLWAHAGMSAGAETVGALLDRYPAMWVELALRSDVAPGGTLDATWRAVFIAHADRFMVGTDTWVPSRWEAVVDNHRQTRVWLAQLPRKVAEKIAYGNADRLFAAR